MDKGNPTQRQLQKQINDWRQDYEKLHAQARETKKVHNNVDPDPRKDKTDKKKAAGELKLKAALRERDALIREIHHRVINHLNLIYNILYFQKQYSEDGRCTAMLESIQKRVKSIALVHEHLDHSMAFNQVRFAEYLKSLLKELMRAADAMKLNVSFKTKIDPIAIDLTTAITCGLIVNELLDNSLKHAFPDKRRGEIFLGLQDRKDGSYALTVGDNGIGLPPAVQWHSSGTMGSFLVNTLTENLRGELTVNADNGTTFQLHFSPIPQ